MRTYTKTKVIKRTWFELNDEEVADIYRIMVDLADRVNQSELDGKVRIEDGLRHGADLLYKHPHISKKAIAFLQRIYYLATSDHLYIPGFEAVLLENEARRQWQEKARITREKNDALRKAGLPVHKSSPLSNSKKWR